VRRLLFLVLVVAAALLSTSASPIRGTDSANADNDGAMPSGRIVAIDDAIYGTTTYGGPNCREFKSNLETRGCGVVYRQSVNGGYTVIHAFSGDDGKKPSSGLVIGRDGLLYGATDAGGAQGHGVIYRLARDGTGFAVLYSFATGDRHGALTVANDGTIFGVAPSPNGDGHGATVFSLSAGGSYRTLYSFGRESHVASPLAMDRVGRVLGIVVRAQDCGGEVFWLTASGAYGRLFSNARPYTDRDCAAVKIPSSPLIESAGTLYATDRSSLYTVGSDGFKVLFTLPAIARRPFERPGLRSHTIVDGSLAFGPDGSLVAAVTGMMGSREMGYGFLFRYSPASGYSVLHTLTRADGSVYAPPPNPASNSAALTYAANSALYGTAPFAADCSARNPPHAPPWACGSLFKIAVAQSTTMHVFEPLDPPVMEQNKYPGISIGMLGAMPPTRLRLSVSVYPFSQAPFSVRTGTSALSLHPSDDQSKTIALRIEHELTVFAQRNPDPRGAMGELSVLAPNLRPGMYALDGSHFNPLITDADGYAVPLNGPWSASFYMPPSPAALPQFRVGQRFVTFHQPVPNVHPSPLPGGLRVVTLKNIEHASDSDYRLTFKDDGSGGTASIHASTSDVNSIPGLTPIVDDENVERLNREFGGRDVYVLGDFLPACAFADGSETNVAIDRTMPLHVKRIVRLYGASANWGIGPMVSRFLDTSDMYVAVDPILVIFDANKDGDVLAEPPFAGHDCVGGYAEFADAWDFERTLARASPLLSHLEWPADVRKAINDGTVLTGMTRDQVIASVGYPSEYGTAAQMRKLDTWEYIEPAPSSFTVKFAHDKVVYYDPPRMPP
jgi:uncharacterized repeat protein (TIGR03803 family)